MSVELKGIKLVNANPDVINRYMQDLLDLDKNVASVSWSEDNFLQELPEKWDLSYLIISMDSVIAFLIASKKQKSYHIHRLGVDPSFQGKGIGSMLLNTINIQALNKSIQSISLKVAKENDKAIKFYKLNGFKIIDFSEGNFIMTKEVVSYV